MKQTLKQLCLQDGISYQTARRRRAILRLGEPINPNNPNGGYWISPEEWQAIQEACSKKPRELVNDQEK